jgi:L-2-hydroxyglutarate oxidase LhgO
LEIQTSQGSIGCDFLINAAGLHSINFAHNLKNFPRNLIPKSYFAKGNYFKLNSKPPFSYLVYPVPELGGLGVHATIDLSGQVRFGPDVQYLRESNTSFEFASAVPSDYTVDTSRERKFYEEIRKYWPCLPDDSLSPDYAGIRPKLSGPDHKDFVDFIIQGPRDHGIEGLVNLFGIESPGITSSLAIGQHVIKCLK